MADKNRFAALFFECENVFSLAGAVSGIFTFVSAVLLFDGIFTYAVIDRFLTSGLSNFIKSFLSRTASTLDNAHGAFCSLERFGSGYAAV